MRVVSICSSSKANCTYIECRGKGLLVDIGCSYKMLCDGLKLAGRDVSNISAVFITHEHSDHIGGLQMLTKKLNVPVYASKGTLEGILSREKYAPEPGTELHTIDELADAPVNVRVTAFHTPHDSAESCDYTFDDGENKIAVCTDLGHITEEVRTNLLGCRFVLLESNYDTYMLEHGPYPRELQRRIKGEYGHLSNAASASMIRELVENGTVNILLGHLSQNNNTPDKALSKVIEMLTLAGAVRGKDYILDAAEVTGSGKAIAV